ncbi:hypothetical protein DFH07DRAFT_774240 [Mycena maculata]|uniref:Uncharacterized protein n=1 Tax=Mycena maculata TaxID=230809 RepID=A0AAD7IYC3_9AGAR|nr:hypothetical protein DFH07DRAFT_774240 [Mycena maculata]
MSVNGAALEPWMSLENFQGTPSGWETRLISSKLYENLASSSLRGLARDRSRIGNHLGPRAIDAEYASAVILGQMDTQDAEEHRIVHPLPGRADPESMHVGKSSHHKPIRTCFRGFSEADACVRTKRSMDDEFSSGRREMLNKLASGQSTVPGDCDDEPLVEIVQYLALNSEQMTSRNEKGIEKADLLLEERFPTQSERFRAFLDKDTPQLRDWARHNQSSVWALLDPCNRSPMEKPEHAFKRGQAMSGTDAE